MVRTLHRIATLQRPFAGGSFVRLHRAWKGEAMAAQFDLVVRNGTVIDGTGDEPREADIAIQDGRLASIGCISGAGREEIDAKGLAVTPGFVDIHTHYDGQVTWDDR